MKRTAAKLSLFLLSAAGCMLLAELLLRPAVEPAPDCGGVLFDRRLPPYDVIPANAPPHVDPDAWHEDLVVDGRRMTRGDVKGMLRPEPVVGYVPVENAASRNGWWRTNNYGARGDTDLSASPAGNRLRILAFGDSFTNCNGARQSDTWPEQWNALDPALEVVNFGVNGYGMGQSYLRYLGLRDRLDFDVVLCVFVPTADLWRDINTNRYLGQGWTAYAVMPRFELDGARLRLIEGPYDDLETYYTANATEISAPLRDHLRRHDRFYSRAVHERLPGIGDSVLYKLATRAAYIMRLKLLRRSLMEPDSEAMRVSRAIFAAMHADVRTHGGRFAVVVLPIHWDLGQLRVDSAYRGRWERMVAALRGEPYPCIDLTPSMLERPATTFDLSHDGKHFGARANRAIAEILDVELRRMPGGR